MLNGTISHWRKQLTSGAISPTELVEEIARSMEQRMTDRAVAEKQWRDQQKEIARQEAYIAQQRQWNRERNIIAAESRLKLLDKMEKLEKPKEAPKTVRIKFAKSASLGKYTQSNVSSP